MHVLHVLHVLEHKLFKRYLNSQQYFNLGVQYYKASILSLAETC